LGSTSHEIELFALGESLQGIARIIAVLGNFTVTGRYTKQFQAQEVRVVAAEQHAECFELQVLLQWAREVGIFQGMAGPTLDALVTFALMKSSRASEQMKHLREALEAAIRELGHKDTAFIARMMDTVDKMVDALKPSVKQAVAPVGKTCETMMIGNGTPIIDRAMKDAIMSAGDLEFLDEKEYQVLITELDLENYTCKVRMPDDNVEGEDNTVPRYLAQITDPVLAKPDNAYVQAMSKRNYLIVRAKATIRDGEIERFYISNTI